MNPLTSSTVLDLWEAGLSMTPACRSVLLLEASGAGDVRHWSVGRRDRELLRSWCSDGELAGVADCPGCAAPLEVSLDPRRLAEAVPVADRVVVERHGFRVVAHPPTSEDVAVLPPQTSLEALRSTLLERCLVEVTRLGEDIDPEELPADVVAAVEEALEDADPGADIELVLNCEECGTAWGETLDPVRFAWAAVETAAQWLAVEVHTLAAAYGWSERDILALTPFRRHLYLSAVRP